MVGKSAYRVMRSERASRPPRCLSHRWPTWNVTARQSTAAGSRSGNSEVREEGETRTGKGNALSSVGQAQARSRLSSFRVHETGPRESDSRQIARRIGLSDPSALGAYPKLASWNICAPHFGAGRNTSQKSISGGERHVGRDHHGFAHSTAANLRMCVGPKQVSSCSTRWAECCSDGRE